MFYPHHDGNSNDSPTFSGQDVQERNDLITNSRKQKTAKAIADGIIEYIRGK